MNSCEQIRPQLSALLDDELSQEEASRAQEHLEHCSSCQAEWQSMQDFDRQLTSALRIENFEQNVNAIEDLSAVTPRQQNSRSTALKWLGAIVAIAASILMIYFSFPENKFPAQKPTTNDPVVARLVHSTGPIEVMLPSSKDWKTIEQSEQCNLVAGAKVRTGKKVVCEFETVDQGKIRMNESAELVLADSKNFELQAGQVWCRAPKESVMQVDAAFDSISIATFRCPSDSQIQCVAEPKKVSCSSVVPSGGIASCTTSSGFECSVEPGKTVVVDPEQTQQTAEPEVDILANSKVWQLPLLAINASPGSELFTSMDQVLAPIGMTKARHLNEEQIRALGPAGAIPLLVFAANSSDEQQLDLRRTAVRLASDLADASAIHLLSKLEADPDATIAAYAKGALRRIAQEAS